MDHDGARQDVPAGNSRADVPGSPDHEPPRGGPGGPVRQALREAAAEPAFGIHPGLVPGISVEDTGVKFPTRSVFVVALVVTLAVLVWAIVAPDHLNSTGTTMQSWVVARFGWLFNATVVAMVIFMLVVGLGPTGRIRLEADDSTPEYSTLSWIPMLCPARLRRCFADRAQITSARVRQVFSCASYAVRPHCGMASVEGADAAGLAHAAAHLHEEFDERLGAAVVDQHVAATAARFASARVQTFVPLLVRRYAGEALRDASSESPEPSSGEVGHRGIRSSPTAPVPPWGTGAHAS